jgi:hypothetical protein
MEDKILKLILNVKLKEEERTNLVSMAGYRTHGTGL